MAIPQLIDERINAHAMTDLFWLALSWGAYAALHSLLASLSVKAGISQRWPRFVRWYRLAFNALATLLLLPLIWASHTLPGDWLWRWTGIWAWVSNGLGLAALVGFWLSSRSYDLGEFIGIRPWLERRADAAEVGGLFISSVHRYVRHPWYFLALVLIWSRDMNLPWLVTAVAITLYFIVGSRLEEQKLEAHFGSAYRDYRARVGGLLPLPGRYLTVADGEALMQRSRQ